MSIFEDKRIVLTLDAGGTNFIFSATRAGEAIVEDLRLDPHGDDLEACIASLKEGFSTIMARLEDSYGEKPVAISFAFPGPADYPNGIIGDLNNLPAFRGGIPLKALLEEAFGLPVFINNDGDLYAYGEALGGILPEVNARLEAAGSPKRYKNLVGLTLGTGFGGGIVRDGLLFTGDNSIAGEVWLMSGRYNPEVNAEDVVSTRSVQRVYARAAGLDYPNELMPKDIFDIATGHKTGDREAALQAYRETGRALGDVIANLVTLTDGIIVIGGGITGAKDLYMPAVMEELSSSYSPSDSGSLPRLVQQVFNLDDPEQESSFCRNYAKVIPVPGNNRTVSYDPLPRVGLASSRIGASRAIGLGAYAFALSFLDSQ